MLTVDNIERLSPLTTFIIMTLLSCLLG